MDNNKHSNDKARDNHGQGVNRNESFGIGKEKSEKGNPGSGRGGTRI